MRSSDPRDPQLKQFQEMLNSCIQFEGPPFLDRPSSSWFDHPRFNNPIDQFAPGIHTAVVTQGGTPCPVGRIWQRRESHGGPWKIGFLILTILSDLHC